MKEAIKKGRPSPTELVPDTVLRHFLYKSKAHVQFVMSAYAPDFTSLTRHRRYALSLIELWLTAYTKSSRLISTYNSLHESVHARNTHVKIHYGTSKSASAFAWVTPIFEFYCVAGPDATRTALSQGANKIRQWVQKEEERLFIIGGAVSFISSLLKATVVLTCSRYFEEHNKLSGISEFIR